MICLNVLYMEYTPNHDTDLFLKIRCGFNCCNFKIGSSILPKFNKIHPYRCYNTTKIYIKSYLGNNQECPICYKKTDKNDLNCPQCNNKICDECKNKLTTLMCPICKTSYV